MCRPFDSRRYKSAEQRRAVEEVEKLLTFAVLAPPFPPALGELPLGYFTSAIMRSGHHACRPAASTARKRREDLQNSQSLPEIRFQQMPGQAGRANPRDRHSCAP